MLQRTQSLYLLLALICLSLMFAFPLAKVEFTETAIGQERENTSRIDGDFLLGLFGVNQEVEIEKPYHKSLPLYIATLLSLILTVATIFLYKNRPKQLMWGRFNFFIQLVVVVLFLLGVNWIMSSVQSDIFKTTQISTQSKVSYGVSSFLLIAALAFTFLANLGIRKDERLVKSLDRIR